MTYDGAESIPMATLVRDTVCCTMSGLSKIYRACGYRVGWAAFSGNLRGAGDYLVGARAAHFAAPVLATCRRSGRCKRRSVVTRASRNCWRRAGGCTNRAAPFSKRRLRSRFLQLAPPKGSMYAFVRVKTDELPDFDDQTFALDLLEQKHVLLAPGTSFNVPYRDHFRTTLLPDAALLKKVFTRIDELLTSYVGRTPSDRQRVVHAEARFK